MRSLQMSLLLACAGYSVAGCFLSEEESSPTLQQSESSGRGDEAALAVPSAAPGESERSEARKEQSDEQAATAANRDSDQVLPPGEGETSGGGGETSGGGAESSGGRGEAARGAGE
ncbi:MAG: hypothetical protein MK135_14750 [Polyangiaceae bacterium]|nr:hypothetical protein [Polyangiaceae bacterium]